MKFNEPEWFAATPSAVNRKVTTALFAPGGEMDGFVGERATLTAAVADADASASNAPPTAIEIFLFSISSLRLVVQSTC
ncbi:MAG: hypothetical protein HYV17_07440 [Xanthomonadales bacterium]|nr:hypothetical protein [Xanthomonadales bacterium]